MFTPMMKQYMQVKEKYSDCILFYRLGDFYEMFFDDAELAAREMELVLTSRECGLEKAAPMCGVPYHSAETYIEKLVENGHKVAICEQLTEPKPGRALVERDVVRIVTPGTLIETHMLDEKKSNYICAVFLREDSAGMAYCDVSTGEFVLSFLEGQNALRDEMARILPGEVLSNDMEALKQRVSRDYYFSENPPEYFDYATALSALMRHFPEDLWRDMSQRMRENLLPAAGALLSYLEHTQKNNLVHITGFEMRDNRRYMGLDGFTRRNLELTASLRQSGKKGTLLSLLDKTSTSMGGRQLRAWVEQPLQDIETIERRLDGVAALHDDLVLQSDLSEQLLKVYDIERLLSRISSGAVNGRDCLSLERTLRQVPRIQDNLRENGNAALTVISDFLDPLESLAALLESAISPDTPVAIKDGGVIRDGYDARLDEHREASRDGKKWIAALEAKERESTGIKNLKVGYNRVFGYFIEVTRAHSSRVPYDYERKQTLANSERYITPELKTIEERVLGAEESALLLEIELFEGIREKLLEAVPRIQKTAHALKTLDALNALAAVALEYRYVRPRMTECGVLDIRAGRHPVVEKSALYDFVPNDCVLDDENHRIMVITGPNMAGKSTYMRQVALIALMAHMGSFVPADSAVIPIIDQIFTRVGASDDLAGGQSTFMVEMSETSYILKNATSKSLIIVDEIGRGTATFDGLSIAWAVVEYIAGGKIGAKTLFATHFHELSELEGHLPGVANYRITVKEHGEEIVFLHKIARGSADKSFGVQVARLAGLPETVLRRSMEITAKLENSDITRGAIGKQLLGEEAVPADKQMDLFSYPAQGLIDELKSLNIMAMTPMEALNALFSLREKAKDL